MTENKTGDFAQNLPDSHQPKACPQLARSTSSSAFKIKTQRETIPEMLKQEKEELTQKIVRYYRKVTRFRLLLLQILLRT